MNNNARGSSFVVFKTFVAGGCASATATLITNPLEVTKVKMQLQSSRSTVLSTMKSIVKNEGVLALQKGLLPSLMRSMTFSSIRLASYDYIHFLISSCFPSHSESFLSRIVSGALAGGFAAQVANPVELVKVRMQADARGSRRYANSVIAFKQIYKEEGVRGLFKGSVAHVQRSAIWAGVQLASYGEIKMLLKSNEVSFLSGLKKEGILLHFTSSMVTGFITVASAHPLDVAKTRMMNKTVGSTSDYRSVFHCLANTFKEEGVRSLYKGFLPNYLRSGTHATIMFVAYEQYRRLFGLDFFS